MCPAAYELQGEGSDGKEKLFRKPWIMTTVRLSVALSNRLHVSRFDTSVLLLSSDVWVQIMFIGMSFCLPIAYWEQHQLKKKEKVPDPIEDPLLSLVRVLPDTCLIPHTAKRGCFNQLTVPFSRKARGITTCVEALQRILLCLLESGFAIGSRRAQGWLWGLAAEAAAVHSHSV